MVNEYTTNFKNFIQIFIFNPSLAGYKCAATVKSIITDGEFDVSFKNFIKSVPEIIENILKKKKTTIDNINDVHNLFLGLNDTFEKFVFQRGEVILMQEIVKYIHIRIETRKKNHPDDYSYFTCKKKLNQKSSVVQTPIGNFYTDGSFTGSLYRKMVIKIFSHYQFFLSFSFLQGCKP